MGNDLKNRYIPDQFQVPDEKQDQPDVENHQKYPQNRFVPANGGKEKGIKEGSQEFAFFVRIDLQRCGMGRRFEDADESDARSDDEYGQGNIDHGNQNKIIKGLQNILL